MITREDVKTKSAMSMLGLLLLLSLAISVLLSPETFRNLLKLLVIALLLFAGLAVASTPRPLNKPVEVNKHEAI
jgi:4-hydroxybenzoate polyprenyltransferase